MKIVLQIVCTQSCSICGFNYVGEHSHCMLRFRRRVMEAGEQDIWFCAQRSSRKISSMIVTHSGVHGSMFLLSASNECAA